MRGRAELSRGMPDRQLQYCAVQHSVRKSGMSASTLPARPGGRHPCRKPPRPADPERADGVRVHFHRHLPAGPAHAGRAFQAEDGWVQMTLSGFLVGFSLGQLLWGPIGDRYGPSRPGGGRRGVVRDRLGRLRAVRHHRADGGVAHGAGGRRMRRAGARPRHGAGPVCAGAVGADVVHPHAGHGGGAAARPNPRRPDPHRRILAGDLLGVGGDGRAGLDRPAGPAGNPANAAPHVPTAGRGAGRLRGAAPATPLPGLCGLRRLLLRRHLCLPRGHAVRLHRLLPRAAPGLRAAVSASTSPA